jgi:transposase
MFSLSPGQAHDDPEGRNLLAKWETTRLDAGAPMLMDRAYEGEAMRRAVWELAFEPVVPPKKNRVKPWDYDRDLYKLRNEIERLFRRLKAYRRIFTRYDKLDLVFKSFIYLALTIELLNCVNTT